MSPKKASRKPGGKKQRRPAKPHRRLPGNNTIDALPLKPKKEDKE